MADLSFFPVVVIVAVLAVVEFDVVALAVVLIGPAALLEAYGVALLPAVAVVLVPDFVIVIALHFVAVAVVEEQAPIFLP